MTDRSSQQLAAVHRTLHRRRDAEETDILLESIVVALADGPMTQEALTEAVLRMWPGARLAPALVGRAVATGVACNLVLRQTRPPGAEYLSLIVDSGESTALTEGADQIVARLRSEIADHLSAEGIPLGVDRVSHLANLLIDALAAGIRESFAALSGEVTGLGETAMIPDEWDTTQVMSHLANADLPDEVEGVLQALALAAIDPLTQFGTDVVTLLAGGYILYSFVARQDEADDVRSAGTLAGAAVFTDTPLLVDILLGGSVGGSLVDALRQLMQSGVRIIVPEHAVGELERLLDGLEHSGRVDAIERSLSDGVDPHVLSQTVDSQVLVAWLANMGDDRRSWAQFRAKVRGLPQSLASLGLKRMRLPSTHEARQLARECSTALEQVLLERPRAGQSASGPNPDAVRDDGTTMALASGIRRTRPGTGIWPSAWVCTPDMRMGEAYRRVDPGDDFPLTIRPSNLAALMARFSPPKQMDELAADAARLVSHRTMLKVACRYPVDEALKIAEALRGESSVEVDLRGVQQVSLHDLVVEYGNGQPTPAQIGAEAANRRARRREAVARQDSTRLTERMAEMINAREAEQAEKARVEADLSGRLDELREDLQSFRRESQKREDKLRSVFEKRIEDERHATESALESRDAERTQRIRDRLLALGVVLLLVAGALLIWTGLDKLAAITALLAFAVPTWLWKDAEAGVLPMRKVFLLVLGEVFAAILDLLL